MMAKRLAFVSLLMSGLFLSACGSGGADGPGSVSPDEAQALDDAAEMLEERRLPGGALPPVGEPVAAPDGAQTAENPEALSE